MSRWFDRGMLALVLALAVAGVIVIAGQSRPARLSTDFTIDYSAGLLLREGRINAPYNQAELAETMRRVGPDGGIDPRLPFNMPLAAALPYAVLSWLPLELAFRIWQVISIGLLLLTLVILQRMQPAGRRALILGALGLLAAVPTWATLTEGQLTPLLPLGAALAIVALRSNRSMLALAAGALLAIKPQYLPAYLIVCLAARAWRPLAAASIGGTLILLSPLVGGWGNLLAMVHQADAANRIVDVRLNAAWIGVLGAVVPTAALSGVAIATFVVAHIVLGWLAWRRPANQIAFIALAGVLGVMSSPHSLPHDLVILAVPVWLVVGLYRQGRLPNPVPALVVADITLVVDLHGIGIPLAPIVITVALAWLLWEFRQRTASQRQPPVVRAA